MKAQYDSIELKTGSIEVAHKKIKLLTVRAMLDIFIE